MNVRNFIAAACFTLLTLTSNAQENSEEETKGKFRKDNIFIGGSVALSLGSGNFGIGTNPEIGYSIAKWLDAGISTNINYFSYKAEYNYGIRQRSTTLGTGIFARMHPIRNVFIQAQPEYNWITTNLRYVNYTPPFNDKFKEEAPSLLLGIGYGQRVVGSGSFFTVIMFDVGNNRSSPYITSDGNKLPVLRTGFTFYLKPKREK
jgi:hypothetical protein